MTASCSSVLDIGHVRCNCSAVLVVVVVDACPVASAVRPAIDSAGQTTSRCQFLDAPPDGLLPLAVVELSLPPVAVHRRTEHDASACSSEMTVASVSYRRPFST